MKTYEQILDDTLDDDLHNLRPHITKRVIARAAKTYTKQWLDKLYKDMNKNQGYGSIHPEYILEEIKKKIDKQ